MDNIIVDYSSARQWRAEAAEWEDRYNKMFNVCDELCKIIQVLDADVLVDEDKIINKIFAGEITAEDLLQHNKSTETNSPAP